MHLWRGAAMIVKSVDTENQTVAQVVRWQGSRSGESAELQNAVQQKDMFTVGNAKVFRATFSTNMRTSPIMAKFF
jgi:hypothetical protein